MFRPKAGLCFCGFVIVLVCLLQRTKQNLKRYKQFLWSAQNPLSLANETGIFMEWISGLCLFFFLLHNSYRWTFFPFKLLPWIKASFLLSVFPWCWPLHFNVCLFRKFARQPALKLLCSRESTEKVWYQHCSDACSHLVSMCWVLSKPRGKGRYQATMLGSSLPESGYINKRQLITLWLANWIIRNLLNLSLQNDCPWSITCLHAPGFPISSRRKKKENCSLDTNHSQGFPVSFQLRTTF